MSAAGKRYQRAGEGERGIGIPGKWYALSRFGRSAERRGPFATREAAARRWSGTGWVYARGEEERANIIEKHRAAWDANRRAQGSPHEVARKRIEQAQHRKPKGLLDDIADWIEGIFR